MRTRTLFAVAASVVALGLLASCPLPFGTDPLTIVGTLTLARPDQDVTLSFIRIRGTGLTTRPEPDGSFLTPTLSPGEYILELTAPGHLRKEVAVAAPEGGHYDAGELKLDESNAVFVSLTGDDANTGLTPDDAVETIHRGLAVARNRGLTVVEIAGGTYDLEGEPVWVWQPMSIGGGFDTNNWNDPDPQNHPTRIVGAGDIFHFIASPGVWIQNLTIVPDPEADDFSRGFFIDASNVWINTVSVESTNAAYGNFEALAIFNRSIVTVTDSTLTCPDTADSANGIHVIAGSLLSLITSEIEVGSSGHSGEVFGIDVSETSAVELEDSVVTVAPATESNIGIKVRDDANAKIVRSIITSGSSTNQQSIGVRVENTARAAIWDSTITSGDSESNATFGISVGGGGNILVDSSTVTAGASDEFAAGITVRDISTAEIRGNALITSGGVVTPGFEGSTSAGLHVESISGAVEVAFNDNISGPTESPTSRPSNTYGILLSQSGSVSIIGNGAIGGGDAAIGATGIGGWGISGTTLIRDNPNIYGGTVADPDLSLGADYDVGTYGISLGTPSPNAFVQIDANEISGGITTRPPGSYGSSVGVVLAGQLEARIQGNRIDGGSVNNLGGFGATADPQYADGPTGISPNARRVVVNANDIRILDPVADSGGTVFVRAIHGGIPGTSLVATNNQILVYNADGPIHVFEPEQYADYVITNNTVIAQLEDVDTGDDFGVDDVAPWMGHLGSSISLTNNIFYFPEFLNAVLDASGFADPEEFDYNYILGLSGSLAGPGTWEGNILGADTPLAIWEIPDTDLEQGGFTGDLNLVAGAPVIDAGIAANTDDLGSVERDYEDRMRNPARPVEDPEPGEDTMIDIGAFEYSLD